METLFSDGGSVQPPSGVLRASVKGIDISLDLLWTIPRLCALGGSLNRRMSSAVDPIWSHELSIDRASDALLLEDSDFQVLDSQGSNFSLPCNDTWESRDDDSPFSSQNSGASSASAFSCPYPVETVVDRVASISLLDAGFRTIFSPNPARTHPKIRSREEPEATALIDIAPNVFNPRYRTVCFEINLLGQRSSDGFADTDRHDRISLTEHASSPVSRKGWSPFSPTQTRRS